jgi:medium-chain acyl-[acyl-carrier-protein] hydrolase
VRLLCFAHGGGTAGVFTPWRAILPESIALSPIELPGRGERSDEPPLGAMAALVERLLPEALPLAEGPFAAFGHSTGAKIAFELCRALLARGRAPAHLFVAASPALGFPAWGQGLHRLPREALVAELRKLGGTPPGVLHDAPLLDLLLPAIRADFQIALEYEVLPGPTLACPITAFAGARDPHLAIGDVAGWRRHTTGPFDLVEVDAGHHLVKERRAEIVGAVARALGREGSEA